MDDHIHKYKEEVNEQANKRKDNVSYRVDSVILEIVRLTHISWSVESSLKLSVVYLKWQSSRIENKDKTMADKLMYIQIDDTQKYSFYRLMVETFGLDTQLHEPTNQN